MNSKRRLIYLLQTKLQTELSDELLHDIDCAFRDHMGWVEGFTEYKKVRHYNELKLWAVRNKKEEVLEVMDRMHKDESIR